MITCSIRILTSATDVVLGSGTTGEYYTSWNVKAVWVTNASYRAAEKADVENVKGSAETP